MLCPKCRIDVNPVKVMGTKEDGIERGVKLRSGFYNQCPECSVVLPNDEVVDVEVQTVQMADVEFRPMAMPRQTPAPTPPKGGSVIDSARAELAQVDAEIAALEGRIAAAKTEIQLKKAHRKGLLSMVSVYERAARPRLREVAQ